MKNKKRMLELWEIIRKYRNNIKILNQKTVNYKINQLKLKINTYIKLKKMPKKKN